MGGPVFGTPSAGPRARRTELSPPTPGPGCAENSEGPGGLLPGPFASLPLVLLSVSRRSGSPI